MIPILIQIAWYLDLAGGAFLVGMGVYRTGQRRKRTGWTMLIAGVVLLTLYAILGPDIIITMETEE